MSKRILAVKVSESRYATFIGNVTIERFKWAFDNITCSSTSNDIVIHLNSDKTMSRLSLSSHFESYPDMELIKYRGNFHTEIYPRFKELLFQSTLVKPKKETMEEYKVSKDFILEAHKAACATWKSKLEKQFPNLFPKTYKVGDVLIDKNNPSLQVTIIRSTSDIMLLCTGKHFTNEMYNGNKVRVTDWTNITEKELEEVFGFSYKYFKLKQ
jgi:hypothetical protein